MALSETQAAAAPTIRIKQHQTWRRCRMVPQTEQLGINGKLSDVGRTENLASQRG